MLLQIATETGKTVPQIAINWVLSRPSVSSSLIGTRNEQQLLDNIGVLGWSLSPSQLAASDEVSNVAIPYPYYLYWSGKFTERNPPAC